MSEVPKDSWEPPETARYAVLAVKATSEQVATTVIQQDAEREDKKRKAEKLSKEELQFASKMMRTVKDSLQKVVNLTKRVTKDEELVQAMEGGAFPAGVRPFRSPPELGDLREGWQEAVSSDAVISM